LEKQKYSLGMTAGCPKIEKHRSGLLYNLLNGLYYTAIYCAIQYFIDSIVLYITIPYGTPQYFTTLY